MIVERLPEETRSRRRTMKKPLLLISLGLAGFALLINRSRGQPPRIQALPAPRYSITLGARDACVTPHTRNRARADGGVIDVQTPSANTISVSMTGTPAADSYLGCTSSAKQTFRLVQEFDVACS